MTTLAVKQGRPHKGQDTWLIVVRRHDLSGTDYEPLLGIDRTVAIALGSRGVVVRGRDTMQAQGHPGIVVDDMEPDVACRCELRADVADPTTVIGFFMCDRQVVDEMMKSGPVAAMHWIGVPPQI